MTYKYKNIVVGGTFDKLHEGHKALLHFAFSLAPNVYITITDDNYTKLQKPHAASFSEREKNVKLFLEKIGWLERAKIFPIQDVYGITDKERELDAIVVTEETRKGAELVNTKRKNSGFSELAVEVMPMVISTLGVPLSTSLITIGFVDENGNLKEKIHDMYLPQSLREVLHKPFGKIILPGEIKKVPEHLIIAVGDVTARRLHEENIFPPLCIIDFVVERKRQDHSLEMLGFTGKEDICHVYNPPATITADLWIKILDALSDKKDTSRVIIVDGEEDLAVLPVVLLSPEGSVICYGQPQVCMVAITIDKKSKQKMLQLLLQFVQDTTRGH